MAHPTACARWCAAIAAGGLLLPFALTGCGSSQQPTEEWESTPAVSPTARLEYRLDSLANENRRMRDQVNAMAAENRNLTARNAELETRLNEAVSSRPTTETAAPSTPATPANRSGYESALALVKQRKFSDAVNAFEGLLSGGIQADLEDNCHYWIGEAQYGMGKYREAMESFNKVLSYKSSEKKNDARFMIGNSYAALGNKQAAREAYEKVLASHPQDYIARKAQERLDRLK